MYYVRYPLSFRQVEDILYERGIDICHETVRFWVERFGSKFGAVLFSTLHFFAAVTISISRA